MTYRELFEQLIAKATASKCGDHVEGGYCCSRAVFDDTDLAESDPAWAEELMRDFLTLDAREVFRAWYGEGQGTEKSHGTVKRWVDEVDGRQHGVRLREGGARSRIPPQEPMNLEPDSNPATTPTRTST